MKRDFISLKDISTDEFHKLMTLSAEMKLKKGRIWDILNGKTIALIFQKPSNRTRVSFEVGIRQLGGNCLYLGPEEINLGKREATSDVAKTLSRYLDGIVARTFHHDDILELSKHATVPIINGLSDLYHPCQGLADIFSIQERFGQVKGLKLAYIGDGNNVCHSLMLGCAKVGIDMSVACPVGYEPDEKVVQQAKSFAKDTESKITIGQSSSEAAKGAHVIYADVWVSMGQEAETEERLETFKDYQINAKLTSLADPDYIFMHCLPAHRDEEVTAEIIDGPHSIIFDQAENRLHTQKAVLMFLLGKD